MVGCCVGACGASSFESAIIAFLLIKIPWIGTFAALCALVTAAAVGVLQELRSAAT